MCYHWEITIWASSEIAPTVVAGASISMTAAGAVVFNTLPGAGVLGGKMLVGAAFVAAAAFAALSFLASSLVGQVGSSGE